MVQAISTEDERPMRSPDQLDAVPKLSIDHPDHVEIASRAFWEACRVDLGRAVNSMQDTWRDPMKEFERVRSAVRKGMTAALQEVSRAYRSQGERKPEEPGSADRFNQTLKSDRATRTQSLLAEAEQAVQTLERRALQGVWIPGVKSDDQVLADLLRRLISELRAKSDSQSGG